MADQKISQLTALTTQASADELVIVDSSASQTKKITVNNLFQGIPVDVGIGTSSPDARFTAVNGRFLTYSEFPPVMPVVLMFVS